MVEGERSSAAAGVHHTHGKQSHLDQHVVTPRIRRIARNKHLCLQHRDVALALAARRKLRLEQRRQLLDAPLRGRCAYRASSRSGARQATRGLRTASYARVASCLSSAAVCVLRHHLCHRVERRGVLVAQLVQRARTAAALARRLAPRRCRLARCVRLELVVPRYEL